ncbi:transposase [Streptomyces mirabilis]|uniref:transposase n=1 Tax=Streptomyces TaxID=1883 RepID=UPI002251807F|nr:transposase [Streptomyces sp. NBC_00268]MCX5188836.1 transposase [Streptomyces sp. NBC_00268]
MAAWATGAGQALIDRELYLPRECTDDRQRCRAAHVPDEGGFQTKPRLAERMMERALPDLPGGRVWVAADEVYGRDGAFRAFLEQRRLPYAVTVQANQTVLPRPGWRHAARLVERCAAEEDWLALPAGPSQLGSRVWQWWVRRIPDPDAEIGEGAWARWFIARRRPEAPGDATTTWPGDRRTHPSRTSCWCPAPASGWRKRSNSPSPPADWPTTKYGPSTAGTGTRAWPRSPPPSSPSRTRPPCANRAPPAPPASPGRPPHRQQPTQGDIADPTSSIPPVRFTAYEISRLIVVLRPQPPQDERITRGLHWSAWRRRHQALARACHRARNAAIRPPLHAETGTTAPSKIYS